MNLTETTKTADPLREDLRRDAVDIVARLTGLDAGACPYAQWPEPAGRAVYALEHLSDHAYGACLLAAQELLPGSRLKHPSGPGWQAAVTIADEILSAYAD